MLRTKGFTIIELMIVLTIAGIVLGFGLPAFSSYRRTLALDTARRQLLEDIRGARQFAVTRRSPVRVIFGTPPSTTNITTYQIHVDANANGSVDAGERLVRRTMPKTTSLAAVSLSPTDTLLFDISGILWPGTAGGTLVFRNQTDRRDTLVVSTAGIAYRP